MDSREYKKGVFQAWALVLFLLAFVAGWTYFTFKVNEKEVKPAFRMGDKPFVPASSRYGTGYPVLPPSAGGEGR